jgi:hypothetical protein
MGVSNMAYLCVQPIGPACLTRSLNLLIEAAH